MHLLNPGGVFSATLYNPTIYPPPLGTLLHQLHEVGTEAHVHEVGTENDFTTPQESHHQTGLQPSLKKVIIQKTPILLEKTRSYTNKKPPFEEKD